MKIVSLTELKNDFSALLDQVKRGKISLLVSERDVPVIKIVAAAHQDGSSENLNEGLFLRLERSGLLRRAEHSEENIDFADGTVKPKKKGDILKALLSDREEGR